MQVSADKIPGVDVGFKLADFFHVAKQQGEGMLRHAVGGIGGHIAQSDTAFFEIIEIAVVISGGCDTDQFQIRGLI